MFHTNFVGMFMIYHTDFVSMFMMYLKTEFYMPKST